MSIICTYFKAVLRTAFTNAALLASQNSELAFLKVTGLINLLFGEIEAKFIFEKALIMRANRCLVSFWLGRSNLNFTLRICDGLGFGRFSFIA